MKNFFTINEISTIFNVPSPTLRYWEKESLIHVDKNNENGYRQYAMQHMLQLSDIIFYRNLNVPIKQLRNLDKLEILKIDSILNETQADIENQIEELMKTNEKIKLRKHRIKELIEIKENQYRIDYPDMDKIVSFEFTEKEKLSLYLEDQYHYTMVSNENNDEFLYNCISVPNDFQDSHIIWSKEKSKNKFILCVTKFSFDDYYDNDLDIHLNHIKNQGYNVGTIIFRYLLSAYDKKQYDYFKTWFEIVD